MILGEIIFYNGWHSNYFSRFYFVLSREIINISLSSLLIIDMFRKLNGSYIINKINPLSLKGAIAMLHEPSTSAGKDPAGPYKMRLGIRMFVHYSLFMPVLWQSTCCFHRPWRLLSSQD